MRTTDEQKAAMAELNAALQEQQDITLALAGNGVAAAKLPEGLELSAQVERIMTRVKDAQAKVRSLRVQS